MSRHQDWDPLYHGDPLPGEPMAVERWAGRYARTAVEVREQATALRRLAQAEGWDSDAGRVFAGKADRVQSRLTQAEERYRVAGSALGAYADRLESLQSQAERLLESARAQQAVMRANEPVARTPFQTPANAQEAALQASVVSADNARAQRYAQAHAQLEALKTQLLGLRTQKKAAAHAAAVRIRGVIDHDALKDSRWDKVKHWVHEHKDILLAIGKALSRVALVLAVAALVLSAGWIAIALIAVSALSVALGLLFKATGTSGGDSWGTIVLNAFGLLAAVKLVPAAAKAATTARGATATAKGNAARRSARATNRQARETLNRRAQQHEGTPAAAAARRRIKDIKDHNDQVFVRNRDKILHAKPSVPVLRALTGDTDLARAIRTYVDLSRTVRAGGGDAASEAALAALRLKLAAAGAFGLPPHIKTVNDEIVVPVRTRLSH